MKPVALCSSHLLMDANERKFLDAFGRFLLCPSTTVLLLCWMAQRILCTTQKVLTTNEKARQETWIMQNAARQKPLYGRRSDLGNVLVKYFLERYGFWRLLHHENSWEVDDFTISWLHSYESLSCAIWSSIITINHHQAKLYVIS